MISHIPFFFQKISCRLKERYQIALPSSAQGKAHTSLYDLFHLPLLICPSFISCSKALNIAEVRHGHVHTQSTFIAFINQRHCLG